MRICHVMLHSCSRTFKIGWQQLLDGHKVHLVTERFIHSHPWRDFHGVHVVNTDHYRSDTLDKQNMGNTIEELSSLFDIFHVHNEPDWIMDLVRQATDKPIAYDIHDMVSMRTGAKDEWEEKALEIAGCIFVPSRLYKENLLGRVQFKPIEEVLSCVPEYLFPKERCKIQYPGIVYEGGLRGKQTKTEQFPWRNWLDAFRKITKAGVPVWAYNNHSAEDLADYSRAQVMVMGPLNLDELLRNLTAHQVGLVGSPYPDPAFQGALPNKLFEYIASGLPVISINAPACEEFLLATGMGIGVKEVDEIPDAYHQLINQKDGEESLKDYIWGYGRMAWTLAGQMQKVYSAYEEAIRQHNFVQTGGVG